MSVVQAVLDFISTELDPTSARFSSPLEVDIFLYKHLADGQDSRFGSFRPIAR